MRSSIDDPARLGVRLPAKDDRVACPRIGEVPIERCLECSWLLRFEADEQGMVVCSLADPQRDLWE